VFAGKIGKQIDGRREVQGHGRCSGGPEEEVREDDKGAQQARGGAASGPEGDDEGAGLSGAAALGCCC